MAKKNLNDAINATEKLFAHKEDTQKPENKKAPVGEKIVFSFPQPKKATSNPGAFTPASRA